MSNFHFFTDLDLLNNQTTSEAFGPVVGDEETKYRLASMHSASDDPKAYAICNGVVFVQEVTTDSSLVNLILRPTNQPDLKELSIKCFVYRGIKKDSLINGAVIADALNNDLTNSIWESQNNRNISAGTTDDAPKEALGIQYTTGITGCEDSDPFEPIFFLTDVTYQLSKVNAGWNIGTFDKDNFGIEILFNSIGFKPSFAQIRSLDNVINLPAPAGTSQAELFEWKHDKEIILNYLDPCAFYGLLYNSILKAKNSTDTEFTNRSGNIIYDDILSKLINKNSIYIDIRNEHNHSLNYYGNYQNNVKTCYDESETLSNEDYYQNGWPIMKVTPSAFPSTNTNNKNVIQISFPTGDGSNNDNSLPISYLYNGYYKKRYPKKSKQSKRFVELEANEITFFSSFIELAVPNNNTLPATTPISNYTRINFLKNFDTTLSEPTSSGTVIRNANYLDNIFSFDLEILWQGSSLIKSNIYDDGYFIASEDTLASDFFVKIGTSYDVNNYTFFAFPSVFKTHPLFRKKLFSITSDTNNVNNNYLDSLVSKFPPKEIRMSKFIVGVGDIDYLEIQDSDSIIDQFFEPDFKNLLCFLVDKTVFNDLKTYAYSQLLSKYKIYFGIKNIQSLVDDLGINYISYEIVVRGFYINASGDIEIKEIYTDPSTSFTSNLTLYSNANN